MKLYKSIIAFFISGVIQSSHSAVIEVKCSPATNLDLIINGGFEKITLEPKEMFRITNEIPGWTVGGDGKGKLFDPGDAHSGKQLLELATTHGYKISQTIKTQPGKKYLLRFWSKHRKPEYSELNVSLKNQPKWACGTPDNFMVATLADWQEYSFTLCPDSHQITLEFGQQYETGGGYGVHLDDVSVVPCATGRPMASTLEFLSQTWVHSSEEDDGSTLVWRKAGSRAFPVSRFRRIISFYEGGLCQFLSLAVNDAHHQVSCRWDFDPTNNKLIIREPTGQIAGNYRINSLTQDLLTISQ